MLNLRIYDKTLFIHFFKWKKRWDIGKFTIFKKSVFFCKMKKVFLHLRSYGKNHDDYCNNPVKFEMNWKIDDFSTKASVLKKSRKLCEIWDFIIIFIQLNEGCCFTKINCDFCKRLKISDFKTKSWTHERWKFTIKSSNIWVSGKFTKDL